MSDSNVDFEDMLYLKKTKQQTAFNNYRTTLTFADYPT